MKDPNQKMRYTKDELSLMKALFAGDENTELMYLIRKVLFQFPLNETESETLKKSMTAPVSKLMQRVFLPELDPDAPLFQMANLVLQLGSDIKGLSPEGAWPFIQAKNIEIKYITQQLKALNGEEIAEEGKIVLNDLAKLDYEDTSLGRDEAYVNLTAWNFLASFIDTHLHLMKSLAGKPEETPEDTLKRLAKDSNK